MPNAAMCYKIWSMKLIAGFIIAKRVDFVLLGACFKAKTCNEVHIYAHVLKDISLEIFYYA